MMFKIRSLSTSIKNFNYETLKFSKYLNSNKTKLVFIPTYITTDLDIKNYCCLFKDIKDFSTKIEASNDSTLIKGYFNELPNISEEDFSFLTKTPLPIWLLIAIIPFAIITWLYYYYKITTLEEKINTIYAKMNTIDFFLQNLTI